MDSQIFIPIFIFLLKAGHFKAALTAAAATFSKAATFFKAAAPEAKAAWSV